MCLIFKITRLHQIQVATQPVDGLLYHQNCVLIPTTSRKFIIFVRPLTRNTTITHVTIVSTECTSLTTVSSTLSTGETYTYYRMAGIIRLINKHNYVFAHVKVSVVFKHKLIVIDHDKAGSFICKKKVITKQMQSCCMFYVRLLRPLTFPY